MGGPGEGEDPGGPRVWEHSSSYCSGADQGETMSLTLQQVREILSGLVAAIDLDLGGQPPVIVGPPPVIVPATSVPLGADLGALVSTAPPGARLALPANFSW